jgi:hypothetical protein
MGHAGASINVNGVDMIKWDDEGKIVEFFARASPPAR